MSDRREEGVCQDRESGELIWIPIVHSREDMGQLQRQVEEAYVRRLGRRRWEAHRKSVAGLWAEIRRQIEGLALDYRRVRLYQDGLPVCGHEEKIVREVAAHGSLNHRLLVDLIDRGARLMGTESPALLLEEYQLNRRILGADRRVPTAKPRADAFREEAKRLLEERDRFIASRIVETLEPGEIGLIFLGMLHSLEGRLPPGIRLSVLRNPQGRELAP